VHVETEISIRAINNLETKINLKTINLNELDLNSINKLIFALIDLIARINITQNESLVYKAIYIAKETLKYSNELIINNLKSKNVLNLISNILNLKLNQNICGMCEDFIKIFLAKENNDNPISDNDFNKNTYYNSNNINISKNFNSIINNNFISHSKIHQSYNLNSHFSQERDENFTFNNQINSIDNLNNNFNNVPDKSNSIISNNNLLDYHAYNPNTFITNSAKNTNISGNNICNDLNNNVNKPLLTITKEKDFLNLSKTSSHTPYILNTKRNYLTDTNRNSNFVENKADCFSNIDYKKSNESKITEEKFFILNGVSSFPLINISKQEEQVIYDANINLKFGDSVHISKTLSQFNFNILNEYPIEYLLQNSEIIKSILIILEKSNQLEYGNIIFRILHKTFDLIEKKIYSFSHNLSTESKSLFDSTKTRLNPTFYPNFSQNNQKDNYNKANRNRKIGGSIEHKISTEHCISVRDFLIICAEALIISTYSPEKLSYAVILLEKNFCFLKKLMIDNNDDEWTIIIRQLFNKLYEVILFYKNKSMNFHLLSILLLRFTLSLSDSAFAKFSSNTNFEIVTIVKEIIFIFDSTHSNLAEETLSKIKRIISKNTTNQKLLEVLNELITEYERAEIIRASIDIAKRIDRINYGDGNQILSETSKYSKEQYKFILDNFSNIFLAYKYFIDTNEPGFINRVLSYLTEKENRFHNLNSNVYNKYSSYSNAKYYTNFNSNNLENPVEFRKNKDEISNNKEFSLIRFLNHCFSYVNTNENYLNDGLNNYHNDISNNELSDCFLKLISFLNSLPWDSPFKYITYLDFLTELQESENLIRLIHQSEILLGIVNDLSQSIENKNTKMENCILEVIHEINFQNMIIPTDDINLNNKNSFNSKSTKKTDNFYYLFEILPLYTKNMKMLSLNSKIEKNFLNLNMKILKYLRLLFSTNESIRLNAINYFKNIFNINSNFYLLEDKIIEYVEFTNNYENLKRLDIIYSIQTAEKEYEKLYKDILSDNQNNTTQIEFYPILNILYSNKMDYNMKTAAIDQLIYLTCDKKFCENFCNEIIIFCYDILLDKLNEYKNVFEKKIIFSNNINNNDLKIIQDYNNLNTFVEEFYKDSNLNYISALMKLINYIILNNSEKDSIKNFLNLEKNEKMINFLNGIIILLFPSYNIENYLNADFKKPRGKHLLNVNLIYFVYLVSFNLKISFSPIIANNLFVETDSDEKIYNLNQYVKNKQNFLLKNYSFIEIHKQYFFNIIPIKNYARFSVEGTDKNLQDELNRTETKNHNLDENIKKRNETKWDNYEIKRNTIEYIKFKNFYTQKSNTENLDFGILLTDLYDEKRLKQSLIFYINESNEPNFLEIFINTSKLFEFYLSEHYRILFSNIKSKKKSKGKGKDHQQMSIINKENNMNTNTYIENVNDNNNANNFNSVSLTRIYELLNFENKESNVLIQILSFLKCLMPNSAEQKNIIIDILNSVKVFLSFYRNFLDFKNPNNDHLNESVNNKNSDFNKVDITNYERYLKELENSSDEVFLPLIKKGLNDCLYNYLTFICNSKNFIEDFQKNTDNQLFLIEILDLVIINDEIFDAEFFSSNSKTILFIIKTFINLFYNSDLLITVRLLVSKLAINLFKFANKESVTNIKNYSKSKQTNLNNLNDGKNICFSLNKFIWEEKNFLTIIIDSIDFFVSNYKLSKLKNLSRSRFNKKNNFTEFNEDELGNVHTYFPHNINEIAFKDISILKSNLQLLSKILDFTNNNSIESHKILSREVQNKIASKSFTLLRYFEFELETEEREINNKICDHIVFSDIIILILDIFEKIKTQEGKLEIIKTNPMILSSLFDFVLNNSAQSVLLIVIVNFLSMLIEDLLKNNYTQVKRITNNRVLGDCLKNEHNSSNRNMSQDEENVVDYENPNNQNNIYNYNSFNASQNLDNINPIKEELVPCSDNNYNQDYNQNQEEKVAQRESFLEEIIILNEKVYDISSLINLLSFIKKNLKNSLLCASLIVLLKKLILLAKMRNESDEMVVCQDYHNIYQENHLEPNKIKSNFYDLICNSVFFEIQNEIFKTQIENFEFFINFVGDDFLKNFLPVSSSNTKQVNNKNSIIIENYSVSYYNGIYYDKLNSKIKNLHELSESIILIGTILDMFCIIFAKCSNFSLVFESNKVIILENLNNMLRLVSVFKCLKSKINKKDLLLFFEANGFSQIFNSVITKYFSLIHLLYHKDANIVNQSFLEINLFLHDFYKVDLNEKFNDVEEFNINYKLNQSILNGPTKKLDTDYENESSFKNSNNNNYNKNEQLFNKNTSTVKNLSINVNNIIRGNFNIENSKANKFIQVCYDLLVLEENDNLEIKVYFAKILPYLIETISNFNKKLNEINSNSKLQVNENTINNSYKNLNKYETHILYESRCENISQASVENSFLKVKNEGETILHLMTGLKEIYNIKYEKNDLKIKFRFDFENSELTEKNSLMFAISSLLLVSQTAKRLLIKSNFISTFIDYIKQLSEKLLELNLENSNLDKEYNKINKLKEVSRLYTNNNSNISYPKNLNNSHQFLDNANTNNKDILDYVNSEYKNVLILLQNLFCNFDDCEEKDSLFIPIEIINQNFFNSKTTNISNLKIIERKNVDFNNNSILSKTSFKKSNPGNNSQNQNLTLTSKTLGKKKNTITYDGQNQKKKSTNNTENNINNFENSKNSVNSSCLFQDTVNSNNNLAANFMKTLYENFQDTTRHEGIQENYFKLLINIISKNDHAKKSFIVSVSNPEAIGNKDSFIIILLEFLQKKFLNNSLNNTYFTNEANINSLDLFIKLLKCLFQNKQIVSFLLKIKFVENFQKDLTALLINKRYYTNKSNQICLTYLLDLMVSLSFDNEIRKKIADKELIEIFTDAVIRIKNENVVYNILFLLRNLSFVNQNKAHFLANENLLGTIFAVLSGEFSLRIKYIISHLLWILLFNNQTVKNKILYKFFACFLFFIEE